MTCSFMQAVYGYQAEIEWQAQEFVRVVDTLGREMFRQCACHDPMRHELLDDAGIIGLLLVIPKESPISDPIHLRS